MKMNFKRVATIVACLVLLINCKKKEEDPAPANTQPRYRVKMVVDKSESVNDTTHYTYNEIGKVMQIIKTNSVGTIDYKVTQQYNASGQLKFYAETFNGYDASFSLTYTDDLVTTIDQYSDLTGSTHYSSTEYFYAPNKDLRYTLKYRISSTTLIVDSTIYTNYSNGRPGIKRVFTKHGTTAYSFQKKTKYTYDARMNRIKEEGTSSSIDSMTFDNVHEMTFIVLGNKQQAAYEAMLAPIEAGIFEENPSPGSKDEDKDYLSGQINSSSCGKGSEYTETIEEENAAGYILKIKRKEDVYNCGTYNDTENTITTVTQELY